MHKAIPLSLLVVLAILAVFYVGQRRTSQELQAQLATKTTHEAELAKAQAQAQQEMAKLREHSEIFQKESATLREKLQRVDPAVRMAAARLAPAEGAGASPKTQEEPTLATKPGGPTAADDPATAQLRASRKLDAVRRMYSDLGRELDLTPDQLEEVYGMLMVRDKNRITIYLDGEKPTGPPQPMAPPSPAERAARDQPLREALGPEKFAKLEAYEKTTGERSQLRSFDLEFSNGGQTMQPAQREQMLQALLEEKAEMMRTRSFPAPMHTPPTEEDIHSSLGWKEGRDRALYQRARQFLTEEQLALFKQVQKRNVENQMQMLRRQQAQAKSGG